MDRNKLKKLAERVCLQISDVDLDYFEKSFAAVLPMVTELLSEKIADNINAMERIISTPLEMSELSKVRHQLNTNILSREEIGKNSFLKASKITVNKKHG